MDYFQNTPVFPTSAHFCLQVVASQALGVFGKWGEHTMDMPFTVFHRVIFLSFWFTHYRVMSSPLLLQNRSQNKLCSNKAQTSPVVKVSLDITVITGYPAHSRNTLDCLEGKLQSQKQLWNNSGIHWRKMKCMRVELILTLMCSRYMTDIEETNSLHHQEPLLVKKEVG